MTAPLPQDIVNGTVLYLKSQPEVVAAVGTFDIQGVPTPGVFSYQLAVPMEQSQQIAVVVEHEGGWATPNLHNTLRFPRLLINVWADPLRDADGNNNDPRVRARANDCFEIIDKFMHLSAGADLMFGPIRVVDCVRLTEPVTDLVRDGDGMVLLRAYYAATQG